MSAIDRIMVTPDVCGGRPCIRGLRIRVKDVLAEDITAMLEFAAR